MNGRVYDYNLGRFMSVDPFIQSPTSTQSINPYSYIMNNPLAGTDPTGYVAAEPELEKVEFTTKTEKVAVTGSHIKREVTSSASGTATYKNGETQSFSASYSNGKLSSASVGGMSSVGSLQQTAAKSGDNVSGNVGSQGNSKAGSNGKELGNTSKTVSSNSPVVDSTLEAVKLYYEGDGRAAELGPKTKKALEEHPDQEKRSMRIKSGKTTSDSGNYKVDMTTTIFHVGRTRVDYSTKCGSQMCTTEYTGFSRDGFWDIFTGNDGPGPSGEFWGGTPYPYIPHRWKETYPNPSSENQ
jgi:hypothetical protein